MRPTRPSRLVAQLALLGAVSLGLTACGVDATETPDGPGADAPEAAAVPETNPLTGLPVDGASSARRRPVLVLKMDNTDASAPQLGLSSADLVVEEPVEGGVTRLAAFYYSDIPGVVGPVRSMRASDIGIVAPVDATMVTSGAAAPTITRLARADVPFVTEGTPGFFREPSRSAPYDLMTDLGEVAESLTAGAPVRPADYLTFGTADDLPRGRAARSIDVRFSPAHTTSWEFRGGTYVDTGSLAAPGDDFPADTVLVLRVAIGDAGYRDPAGNTVPEAELVGTGDATLLHDGRAVEATWSKTTDTAPFTLTTAGPGGEDVALPVPAGRTWVELVPLSGAVDVG